MVVRPPPRRPLAGHGYIPASTSGDDIDVEVANTNTLANNNHPCPVDTALRPVQADNGLSHHGDPASDDEVIVLEEPEKPSGD